MYKSIIMPKNTMHTSSKGKKFLITHVLKIQKQKKVEFKFNFHEQEICQIGGDKIDIAVLITEEHVVLKFVNNQNEMIELWNEQVKSKNIIDLYMNSVVS